MSEIPATDEQIKAMKTFWEEMPEHPSQRLLSAGLLKKDFLSLLARLEGLEDRKRWRPISEADKTIVNVMEFPAVGMTVRNSAPIMARDEDGRMFECVWTDHRGGYWWDLDDESPVDPIDFQPIAEPQRDALPQGHTVLEQADLKDCRVSQTVRIDVTGEEYERVVHFVEAYGEKA